MPSLYTGGVYLKRVRSSQDTAYLHRETISSIVVVIYSTETADIWSTQCASLALTIILWNYVAEAVEITTCLSWTLPPWKCYSTILSARNPIPGISADWSSFTVWVADGCVCPNNLPLKCMIFRCVK